MKKILIVLGVIFLALIVVGVVGFGIIATKGAALDKESKAYVDKVTPVILSSLSKETLFQYADDQLKNAAKPEEFEIIFKMFSKLGKFKEYKGSTGQVHIAITSNGKQISGQYIGNADFETGPATITITTMKRGTGWKILGFRINSMALAN